jgi:8-oxo-dGTP diphosphatase
VKRAYEQDFSHLFREVTWGSIRCTFERRQTPPPADLIGSVNLIPFCGERWLVIRLQNGFWELPGGTLEPRETYLDAIRRELLEEAGAHLVTFEPLGAWKCHSTTPTPYRPHLPHPEFYRFVGYGQVERVGTPQNPQGGERVVQVECAPIKKVCRLFRAIGRPELAELYRLAAEARKARGGE